MLLKLLVTFVKTTVLRNPFFKLLVEQITTFIQEKHSWNKTKLIPLSLIIIILLLRWAITINMTNDRIPSCIMVACNHDYASCCVWHASWLKNGCLDVARVYMLATWLPLNCPDNHWSLYHRSKCGPCSLIILTEAAQIGHSLPLCESRKTQLGRIPIDPAILAAIGHYFIAKETKNAYVRIWGETIHLPYSAANSSVI